MFLFAGASLRTTGAPGFCNKKEFYPYRKPCGFQQILHRCIFEASPYLVITLNGVEMKPGPGFFPSWY